MIEPVAPEAEVRFGAPPKPVRDPSAATTHPPVRPEGEVNGRRAERRGGDGRRVPERLEAAVGGEDVAGGEWPRWTERRRLVPCPLRKVSLRHRRVHRHRPRWPTQPDGPARTRRPRRSRRRSRPVAIRPTDRARRPDGSRPAGREVVGPLRSRGHRDRMCFRGPDGRGWWERGATGRWSTAVVPRSTGS